MEKFGIFNLLSALAGMNGESDAGGEQKTAPAAAETGAEENVSAEVRRPEQSGVLTAEERLARAEKLLERHEAISKRIDKNNRR